jgi:hypothetical protein
MALVAFLLTGVVPLHFMPPVDFERRFLYVFRSTTTSEAGTANRENRLDLKVRISGRNEDLTAVDTTILRARLKLTPNLADYPRRAQFERLAKGTLARAMVTPNGGVHEMNVLRTASEEKGLSCGATIAPLAAFSLHGFWLPGRLTRVGDTWKADFEVKRPLSFEGITAPEKTFPVHYTLTEVREFHGVKHARIRFRLTASTDAEKDGRHFVVDMKEQGEGWINVKTGFPRQIRSTAQIATRGDYQMRSQRVITVTAM